MTDLITFHDDSAVKAKYLARVDRHIKADELIRGTGWDGSRGCAVGCTLETYDHALYPVELGIPEWLARLEDSLFEGMSEQKSRSWPRDFLAATPVGISADRLERDVKAPLMIYILEGTRLTFDHAKHPAVLAAIDGVIALWGRSDIGSKDWKAAAAAAAWAAEGAAEAAAAAAAAAEEAAAAAAWAAEGAAEAAAEAAAAAAWAAAWAATWAAAEAAEAAAEAAEAAAEAWPAAAHDRYADKLLELLSGLSLREPA